jgi:hypothetical protein
VAVVLGFIIYSTFGGTRYRVEVCIVYKGNRDCRTASATTRENALRTAITNACAQLAGGVIETSQCESTPPQSIRWIE